MKRFIFVTVITCFLTTTLTFNANAQSYNDTLANRIKLSMKLFEQFSPYSKAVSIPLNEFTNQTIDTIFPNKSESAKNDLKQVYSNVVMRKLQKDYKKEVASLYAQIFTSKELEDLIALTYDDKTANLLTRLLNISGYVQENMQKDVIMDAGLVNTELKNRLQDKLNEIKDKMKDPKDFDSDEEYNEKYLAPLIEVLMEQQLRQMQYSK